MIIALAKKEELIYQFGREEPIRLGRENPGLKLCQMLRDESHRFAINYHRTLRNKRQTKSLLDEIPGIGINRKQKLLSHFKSLKRIRAAPKEELLQILGPKLGAQVFVYLKDHPPVKKAHTSTTKKKMRLKKKS